jgi:membrane protein required for colicin V production
LGLAARSPHRHNARVILFANVAQEPAPPASSELLQQLQTLSWVDHTALGVVLVFFVLGLFKGLIWQVSRVAILVCAYVVSGRFGGQIADWLAPGEAPAPGVEPQPASETTIYLAYVLLFLAVLIVLSLLAMLLQKLAAKAGLSFFDRVGGGLVGVATGACVVLFGLFVVNMFFRESQIAHAAEGSHSLRLSKRAIDWLGDKVPDDLRSVFALQPLQPLQPALRQPPGENPVAPLPGVTGDAPPQRGK